MTGRSRIADEVLEGLRTYLLVANGPGRVDREGRIKNSLIDLEKDPLPQKTMLRLELAPMQILINEKGESLILKKMIRESRLRGSLKKKKNCSHLLFKLA